MTQVSIIIPVYKGNCYIPKIIHMLEDNWEAVNKIGHVEIEAVFVNDYPAEPLGIREHWVRNISWLAIENQRNMGIHFSRVQGFLRSKGEYILFLDQDDEISPVYLREQLMAVKGYDAVICNGKNYSNLIYRNDTELKKAAAECEYKKGFNQIVAPGQVLLRKKAVPLEWTSNILKSNGADDYFLWMLLFWKKCKVQAQDKVLYWHSISDENTSKNWDEMNQSVLEMAERMENFGYLTADEVKGIRKTRCFSLNKQDVPFTVYEKEKNYKSMLELWMTLRDKRISVTTFLSKMHLKDVAIYGGGILGRHLYYELKGSDIQVKCILDLNRNVNIEGLGAIVPGEPIERVDAIIVTPFMEYKQIKEQLGKSYSYKIVSIESVLFNADCRLMTE